MKTLQSLLLILCSFLLTPLSAQDNIVREAVESFLNPELLEQNTQYNEEDFEKVNHDEPGAFFDRSMKKYEQGFYHEAIEDLDKVFELIEDCRECYEYKGMTFYYRGLNYLQMDSTEFAKQDFKRAFEEDPLMVDAYNDLSNIFIEEEELDSARHYLKQAVNYSPGLAMPHYNLGVVDLLEYKSQKAIKNFESALERQPCLSKAYLAIAFAHAIKDRLMKATDNIETAINCEGDNLSELYYWKGVLMAERNKLKDSLVELNNAIDEDSEKSTYYNTRALVLVGLKAYRKALEDFSKAFELNPTEGQLFKGNSYTKKRQLERQFSIEYYNRHKDAIAPEVLHIIEEGLANLMIKRSYDANAKFKEALKINKKDNPLLFFLLGLSYAYTHDKDNAYFYLDEALKLDDDIYEAHYKRGLMLLKDNHYNRAMKDFEAMIRLKPQAYLGYKEKGNLLLQQGKYQEAAKEYTQLLQIDSTDMDIYYNRGAAWEKSRQFDKAVKDYQKVVKKKPYDIEAYHHKALSNLALQRFDAAIADCDSMISIFKSSYKAYGLKGLVYLSKGDYSLALENLDKATDIRPTYVEAWFDRALTYYKLKDWEHALSDMNNVISLQDNVAQYYYMRGAIKKNLNDKSACTDIKKALKLGLKLAQSEIDRICD